MIKYVLATILLGIPAQANAQVAVFFSSGTWSVSGGIGDTGEPMCTMSTTWQGGRYLGIKYILGNNNLLLHFYRETWRIPPGARVDIRYEFDNLGPWTHRDVKLHGGSGGKLVEAFVRPDQVKTFMEELMRARRLEIQFTGREPNWVANLTGSRAAAGKFIDCTKRVGLMTSSPPTQPFAPSTQPF